jgi:transcriptional regulator with XRE-family HTH domain
MNRKIKALLIERGIKQKDIAAELGVLLSTVSGVINGHHSSHRIKEHIAKKLHKPYEKLWGKAA